MTLLTKEQIDDLFKKLFLACTEEGAYSTRETAEKIGLDYQQILAWAEESEWRKDLFQECRYMCSGHAELDAITFKLDPKKAHAYRLEDDEEYAEYFHTIGKYLPEFADVVTNEDIQKDEIRIILPTAAYDTKISKRNAHELKPSNYDKPTCSQISTNQSS